MKEIQTRSQQMMKLALELVQEVAEKYPDKDDPVRKAYGSLCHNFPPFVRTCGLCQAVAFSVDKASAADSENKDDQSRGMAHRLLLEHVAKVLNIPSRDDLLDHLLSANLEEYMLLTRQVLSSWVYFKRFARSILKVEPGGNNA